MSFQQYFEYNLGNNQALFEIGKKEGNKKNFQNSILCAEQIIANCNEDLCLGVFIILKIKKMQNILLDSDIDRFFNLMISYEKITSCTATKSCIKIINKYLISNSRPKSKRILLLSYSDDCNKIITQDLPFNFSFVDENVAGSAIIKITHIKLLHDLQFTTIINLMEENYSQDLLNECKKLNIALYHFPIPDRHETDHYTLNKILNIIEISSKTIVHCLGGIGRTNMILSSYLIKKQNISPSEVISILDRNRKIILTSQQNIFIKDFYRICNSPKNNTIISNKINLLPNLIMFIGCPCSGKTTFALELLTKFEGIIHINQDELGKKECEKLFSFKCKDHNLILDRCNYKKKDRLEWIKSYKQLSNGKICAIYFNLDIKILKNRMKNRINHPTLSGSKGINIMGDILKSLEIPSKEEGYDDIITINNDHDLLLIKNKFGFGFEIDYNQIIKFPRTKHLINLGSMTKDDKIFHQNDLQDLLTLEITLEEKIDGANLGIFYDYHNNKIIIQNRSHFISSNDHIQFKLLDKWISKHSAELMEVFNSGNYIIYGEWLYMKHSIHYNKLPDLFIAYDIYDRIQNVFLERSKVMKLLKNSTIHVIRIIYEGKITLEKLKSLANTDSIYYDGPVEGVYIRAFENDIVKYRGKIVRSDFICGDTEHWTKKQYVFNSLLN